MNSGNFVSVIASYLDSRGQRQVIAIAHDGEQIEIGAEELVTEVQKSFATGRDIRRVSVDSDSRMARRAVVRAVWEDGEPTLVDAATVVDVSDLMVPLEADGWDHTRPMTLPVATPSASGPAPAFGVWLGGHELHTTKLLTAAEMNTMTAKQVREHFGVHPDRRGENLLERWLGF